MALLVGVVIFLVVALGARVVLTWRRWQQAIQGASNRRRAALSGAWVDDERELASGPTVLQGVLEVQGESRGDRDRPLAASSLERLSAPGPPFEGRAIQDERADALSVTLGKSSVRLEGLLRVLVGSHQQFRRQRLPLYVGPVVARELRPGDPVQVAGTLRQIGGASGYRDGRAVWELHPDDDRLLAASANDPRNRIARRWLLADAWTWMQPRPGRLLKRGLVIVALVGMAVLGARGEWHDRVAARCAAGAACQQAGMCTAVWVGLRYVCGATLDAHCRQSDACTRDGRCEARDRVCDIKNCAAECTTHGRCRADGPRCIAVSPKDCEGSWSCQNRGLCTLRNDRCVLSVNDDRDCSNHITCKSDGSCSSTPNGCLAATDEDCLASEVCQERGRCSADGLGFCKALSDGDCSGSEVCERLGFCTAVEGGCSLSLQDRCGSPTECDYRGKCAKRGDECVPTEDGHCALSLLCKLQGRCRHSSGECVK